MMVKHFHQASHGDVEAALAQLCADRCGETLVIFFGSEGGDRIVKLIKTTTMDHNNGINDIYIYI